MRGSRKFCQRGSNFDNVFLYLFLVDEVLEDQNTTLSGGGSKYHSRRAIIGPPAKHLRWRAADGPTLNAGLVASRFFQGIWTRIAEKPYIFAIFQGGLDPLSPPPPPLDPHMQPFYFTICSAQTDQRLCCSPFLKCHI